MSEATSSLRSSSTVHASTAAPSSSPPAASSAPSSSSFSSSFSPSSSPASSSSSSSPTSYNNEYSTSSSTEADELMDQEFDLLMSMYQKPPSISGRLWAKTKEDPLIPIGLLATVGAFSMGMGAFLREDSLSQQKYMRMRVGAQAFTLCALLFAMNSKGRLSFVTPEWAKRYIPASWVVERKQPLDAVANAMAPFEPRQ